MIQNTNKEESCDHFCDRETFYGKLCDCVKLYNARFNYPSF